MTMKEELEELDTTAETIIREFPYNVTWGPTHEVLYIRETSYPSTASSQIKWFIPDDIVHINIAGELFQTYRKTLEKYPDSLLGSSDQRQKYFRKQTGEFYFDRHIEAFESILYYYQSGGEICVPSSITLERFIEELVFFKMGESVIEQLEIDNGLKTRDEMMVLPELNPFRIVWKFLEYPDTSGAAKIFALFSVMVILVSLMMFVIETMPQFSPLSEKVGCNNTSSIVGNKSIKICNEFVILPNKHASWMYVVNTAVIIWFTIEFILRLLSCPSLTQFAVSLGNIIDFLSILPYYMALFVNSSDSRILSVIRVIRVLRVLKLSRHSTGLQILGKTFYAAHEELSMFVFLMSILCLLFASIVYYTEQSIEDSEFISIPHTLWWAVVTLTTVGYGDLTPRSLLGKMITCLVLLSGVILISMPIPSVVSHFTHFANAERNRRQLEEAKKSCEKDNEEDLYEPKTFYV